MQEYKYEQIIETILNELNSGTWNPGDKIASERDLVIRYGVSRITIKKALEELISRGVLIRYLERKGTFVRNRDDSENKPSAKLIGVAIDDVSDSFGATLLRGIEDYLWNRKIHTVICNGDRNFRKVEEYFQSLLQSNIDGVIFSPVIDEEDYISKNRKIMDLLKSRNVPFVLVDRTIPGEESSYVSSDHREGAELLTKALISQGHKDILLLKGLPCSSMDEREKGFLDALTTAGLPIRDDKIISLNDNQMFKSINSRELKSFEDQLNRAGDYTAVIALNNRLLNGYVTVMESRSADWRRRIALGLHDKLTLDIPDKEEIFQVIEPNYEMGREAARLLSQTIAEKNAPTRRIILQSKLIPGRIKTE